MKYRNRFAAALMLCAAFVLSISQAHAAAGAWTLTNAFKTRILNGGAIDLDTDTIKFILLASTTNVVSGPADCYTGGTGTAVTNELSTANGYTAGGATAASLSISGTSTVTYDTADAVWTASGGSIAARYVAMVDTTVASKTIIAYALLDTTPADVTATTGNTFTIGVANVFTLAQQYLFDHLYPSPMQMAANDANYVMRKAG